jgi:hypothetical protein
MITTKCIKCGSELHFEYTEDLPNRIVSIQCTNPECSEFNKPWTLAEHKDNQDWAVRHIRALEQRVQTLESQIQQLIKSNNELVRWQKTQLNNQ